MSDAFSNGQSKMIVMEIVSLVRHHALCDQHNLRLNVYVTIAVWNFCIVSCVDVDVWHVHVYLNVIIMNRIMYNYS